MKTSDIKVGDMLSVLSVVGVEDRIGEVPGVESVTVNYAAAIATVRYDETRLNVADIKSAVRQGEYEAGAPAAASTGHKDHGTPGAPPATPAPVALKSTPDAAAATPGATPTTPAATKTFSTTAPDPASAVPAGQKENAKA